MPHLRRANYPRGTAAALIVSACPLGLLIPPSASQILYAWVTQQSTWYFQCWYRDVGNTNNFTDAVSVTFL